MTIRSKFPASLLALVLLLCACNGDTIPASRQDLDVSAAHRAGVEVTGETPHRAAIGFATDSVVIHWTVGMQGASRVISKADVEIPAHARSESYRASVAGVLNKGTKEAGLASVVVSVEYKSSKPGRATQDTRTVLISADGSSLSYADAPAPPSR